MVWSTTLALAWLIGVEPAPVEDESASPVPPSSQADTRSEPAPPPTEGTTTPSPFDGLTPQPPPPRGERADLFDPWQVPLQSVVPRPAPPRTETQTDPPLLDPWRPPGPGHVAIHRSPDLRHPFATAARDAASFATRGPDDAPPTAAAPLEPAPRLAHADLRDPFAGPPSTRAAAPVASPADLRDPFGARRHTAPPATPSLPEVDAAAEPPPLSPG